MLPQYTEQQSLELVKQALNVATKAGAFTMDESLSYGLAFNTLYGTVTAQVQKITELENAIANIKDNTIAN